MSAAQPSHVRRSVIDWTAASKHTHTSRADSTHDFPGGEDVKSSRTTRQRRRARWDGAAAIGAAEDAAV